MKLAVASSRLLTPAVEESSDAVRALTSECIKINREHDGFCFKQWWGGTRYESVFCYYGQLMCGKITQLKGSLLLKHEIKEICNKVKSPDAAHGTYILCEEKV